ncbi:probable inactive receptor kinase At2g26730 [Impatiens glandulifera]|uniref:probable inactive receptor kinase At2g26730 n=1 Tax=Impatiens glandulifera TaxID=253017 RepID=UPI001FB15098|nr:probable inactive receptor kinase At2g26730 [Impatiens glandulifera]
MAAKRRVVYYHRAVLFTITWMSLLQNHHVVHSADTSPDKEKIALNILFQKSMKMEELNWNPNTSTACSWPGVTCDNNNRVKYLRLPGKAFIGQIPENTIGLLTKLRELSLRFNKFSGQLPSDFSNLTLLRSLNLHNNTFSGHFPLVITKLTNLQTLDISANRFSGNIPCAIQDMPLLKRLRLENNRFTGNLPGLHFLRSVNFSVANNNITGSVPTTLSKLPLEAFAGNPLLCGEPLSSPCIYKINQSYFSISEYCSPLTPQPIPTLAKIAMPGGGALYLLLFIIILLCPVRRKQLPPPSTRDLQGSMGFEGKNKLVIFPENNHRSGSSWAKGLTAADVMSASVMDPRLAKGKIGTSYKVELLVTDRVLVVKNLMDPEAVVSGELDFADKMEFLGKIRHDNVMPLRGYCIYKEEYLMIYDFIPGGSLYDCLHGNGFDLDWESRKRIALGAARGLAHLHKEKKLVHGNIKSSNILLHGEYPVALDAYVADFGLTATPPTSYYGPETTTTVATNIKSDVYAFGVLLLELLTGKSADDRNLVQEMQSSVTAEGGANDDEILDSRVMIQYDEKKKMSMVCLLQIAKQCTHEVADERPKMEKVARMIENIHDMNNMNREDEIGNGLAGPVEEMSHEVCEDSLLHPGTPPPPDFTP